MTFGNGGAGGLVTLTGNVVTGGNLILATVTSPYTLGSASGSNTLTTVGGIIASSSATINATVVLQDSQSWAVSSGQTLTVNAIGESPPDETLTKAGVGTLLLNGAASYTGGTMIDAGTVEAGANNVFATTGLVTLANDATADLDVNGLTETIGSLSGGGSVGGNVSLGAGSLYVGDATTQTYAGVIGGIGGNLIKQGSGTLVLANSETYTGTTTIAGGVLTRQRREHVRERRRHRNQLGRHPRCNDRGGPQWNDHLHQRQRRSRYYGCQWPERRDHLH